MAGSRKSRQEKLDEKFIKMKVEDQIYGEYEKFVDENGEGTDVVSSAYLFATSKAPGNSTYKGYSSEQIRRLIKKRLE